MSLGLSRSYWGLLGISRGVIGAQLGSVKLIGLSGHQWVSLGLIVRGSRAQWDSIEIIGHQWGSMRLSGAQ